jgi:hypothetical protein
MKIQRSLIAATVAAVLGACGGGEVNLNVATTDNSVNNGGGSTGGGASNPCASYSVAGSNEVRTGQFDGRNCIYNSQFVGTSNPLTTSVTIPFISGVHIFQDSLVVGRNVSSGAAPAGGSGPKLTIAAGNTLAFADSSDYVLINRGSQILAGGSSAAPITFTSFSDAVSNNAGANDVSQWGGLVINGNGITNNCTDSQRQNNQCHVVSEGQPSNYGGNDNADNSGVLRYVVLKHTGFEVAPGDELNGVTFNAVGSGTTVENVQVYSTFDDGFEFFGGAVNAKNLIALYTRDDALDFSDGYVGTIENALVIQWQTDGQQCIELDNIGSARQTAGAPLDTAPITAPTVKNMTCIMSAFGGGTHGNSEGVRVRLGGRLTLENSIISTGYGNLPNPPVANRNYCYRVESAPTQASAVAGTTQVDRSIVACTSPSTGNVATGPDDTVLAWLQGANPSAGGRNFSANSANAVITSPNGTGVSIFEPGTFYTAQALNDGTAAILAGANVGAVRRYGANVDWTSPWAFGLRTQNADQKLWFAP